MTSKPLYLTVLALLLALLSGCASVPMAPDGDDAQAKTYTAKPGKANIYVFRNETMGSAITMTVSLNGKVVGQTAAKTYMLFEVDPGNYEVASHTENLASVRVAASAGRNYFVWQEVKMGLAAARSNLQVVDEATGRKGVEECKRVQLKM
jgi:hypothetical protein